MKTLRHSLIHTLSRYLLLTLALFSALHANALTFEYGDFTYVTTSDTTVRLAYRGWMNPYHVTGHLEIPSTVNYEGVEYSVSEISDLAFGNCGITSLIIPGTVKRIGINSFYRCPLTELILEEGVQLIDRGAFAGCDQLETLTLPSSITTIKPGAFTCQALKSVYIKGATDIDTWAFQTCTALEHVTLGKDVSKVGSDAFTRCSMLTEITIEDGENMLTCDSEAFDESPITKMYIGRDLKSAMPANHCNTLEHVTIGPKVTYIVQFMFSDCTKLTEIVIPNNVTIIQEYAFEDCIGLKDVVIGDGVEKISNYAFQNCTGLTSLSMGKNIKKIGLGAFLNCTGLSSEDVQFPDSLETINAYAFTNCTGLTEITFPSNIKRLAASVFQGCSELKKVVIEDSSDEIYFESNSAIERGLEFKDCPLQEVYMGRNQGRNTCDDDVDEDWPRSDISDAPFSGFKTLKKVTISNQVTWIPEYYYAFTGIFTVMIPNSVKSIQHCAFSECSNLNAIVLGNGLNTIDNSAFYTESLMAVYSMSTDPPTLGNTVFNYSTTSEGTLYVPTGSKAAYQSANGWKEFRDIVETDNFDEVIAHLDEVYGHIPGDINGDGVVNIADANSVIEVIINGSGSSHGHSPDYYGEIHSTFVYGDINSDGVVNIGDINTVINLILTKE